MKAVVYDKKNTSDKFIYSEVEKPIPKENEILVKIRASSLNAADYRMMQLGMIPKNKIFGADISGIVESVGKKVTKFKPGDSVVGELSNFGFGGFAEYVSAPEKAFILKPKGIFFEEASAFPLAGSTALQALRHKGFVKQDSQVLILGCSGGVGIYAIQLAKYYGAIVTGVCSAKKIEQSMLLGVDSVLDYKKVNLSELSSRYDLILGVNGDYSLSLCKQLLKPNGRYITVGGGLVQIFKSIFLGWMMSFGSRKMTFLTAKSNAEDMEFIFRLVVEGKIRTVIDKIFPLREISSAFSYIEKEHAKGKVVISTSVSDA
jgi:NADPH:quinone reductase-like Zn-dependent oxidoreductase